MSVNDQPAYRINYVELYTHDIAATKAFYGSAFGWDFQDWGPSYVGFTDECGLEGGFELDPDRAGVRGALVILHAADLDDALARVVDAGGEIIVPVFSFPGGRRFQFTDPSGNELAVWTTLPEE